MKSSELRSIILKLRPEWKQLKGRLKVSDGDYITLMTGLLTQEVIDVFNKTGTLPELKADLEKELGVTCSLYPEKRGECLILCS